MPVVKHGHKFRIGQGKRPRDGKCRFPGCGRTLSIYNKTDQCFFHTEPPGKNRGWECLSGYVVESP